MGNEKMVRVNGVDLCVETFGDPADPAILLIHGAAASMDFWADEFCARLAAGPRFVIRYDNRDTGRSVSYPPGQPGYTGDDLTADALGVLDALSVARAHLVGISMGGGTVQEIAVNHPDRVTALTAMSTTFYASGGPDLPGMTPEMNAAFNATRERPDWSDRAAVIDYMVADWLPFSGPAGATEADLRQLAGRVFDRTTNVESSMVNHWLVAGDGDSPGHHRLGEITMPALVIHGTADPLFPFPHGEALAAAIPGAILLPLPGVGHETPPPATWDTVVAAIIGLTARG